MRIPPSAMAFIAPASNRKPTWIQQQTLVRTDTVNRNQMTLSQERISEALDKSTSGFLATSSLLSNVGKMDASQKNYHDESRLYSRMVEAQSTEGYSPDYYKPGEVRTSQSFSVTIETQEGDLVTIEIAKTEGTFKGSSETYTGAYFNYEVEGNLNAQEQEALNELAVALGGASQSYFSNNSLSLKAAKAMDSDQLSSFDLKLVNESDTASFSFEVSEQQQNLSVEQNDYTANITIDLSQIIPGSNLLKAEGYLDQLDLIDRTAKTLDDTRHDPMSVASFFKGVLDAAFSSATNNANLDPSLNKEDKDPIQRSKEYLSGLPDFKASFASKFTRPNPDKKYEENGFSLKMGQKTHVEEKGGLTHVFQVFTGDMISMQHKSTAALMAPDFDTQSYKYSVESLNKTTTREVILNKTDVIDATMEVREEEEKSEDTFEMGELTERSVSGKRSVAYYSIAGINQVGYHLRDYEEESHYNLQKF